MRFETCAAVVLASLLAGPATADVLELKDGRAIDGKYAGGTAASVRFEVGGEIKVFETGTIVALTFTAPKAAPAAPPPAAPLVPAATGTPVTVVVPAGTPLLVRVMDAVSSQHKPGTKFTTTLETDLKSGDVLIASAGTKVYGVVAASKQAGRLAGKSVLDLKLEAIQIDGKNQAIATGSYKDAGSSSLKKTAGGAAIGAVIGGAASDDAGKGAAIGAAVSVLKKGETITVPPGALLQFQLTQPANLVIIK